MLISILVFLPHHQRRMEVHWVVWEIKLGISHVLPQKSTDIFELNGFMPAVLKALILEVNSASAMYLNAEMFFIPIPGISSTLERLVLNDFVMKRLEFRVKRW